MLSAFTMQGKKLKEGRRKLLEVMDMFMALIGMMVSHVSTYLPTHQVIYIKYLYRYRSKVLEQTGIARSVPQVGSTSLPLFISFSSPQPCPAPEDCWGRVGGGGSERQQPGQ